MTSKVKGTEGIEFPDATVQASAAYSKAETNSQTWQDVKASRALLTNYTNNTEQAIEVNVTISSTALNTIRLTVDGLILFGSTVAIGGFSSINASVPAGAVYQISAAAGGTQTLQHWAELR